MRRGDRARAGDAVSRGVTWLVGGAAGLRVEIPCAWVRCDAPGCEEIAFEADTIREVTPLALAVERGWVLGPERDACEVHR